MLVIIIDGYVYKNTEINNKIVNFLTHMHKKVTVQKLFEISKFYKNVSKPKFWARSNNIDFMNLEYKNIINDTTNANKLVYDLIHNYAIKWKKKCKSSNSQVCILLLNKDSLSNIAYLINKAFKSNINIFCI